MTINSLSPAYMKMNYARDAVVHTAVYPTKFSSTPTPGSSPSLLNHVGAAVLFTDFAATWANLIKELFGSTVDLVDLEIWSQPTPADDPVWIYTTGLGVAGTSATASIPAQEQVFTFRSDLGGLFRAYFMETAYSVDQSVPYASMTNPALAVANYVTGSTSVIYARDNGKPIHTLRYKTKINDVLRRRLLTG